MSFPKVSSSVKRDLSLYLLQSIIREQRISYIETAELQEDTKSDIILQAFERQVLTSQLLKGIKS